jgi:diguanylate cyclase (GGDEF)-like protein
MSVSPASPRAALGLLFDLAVCCVGLGIATWAVFAATANDEAVAPLMCVGGVLLTVVVARFPIVFDKGEGHGGGIEVGFDSAILMFMLCTLSASDALVVWSLGVVATQLTSDKRFASKVFNIGVGIIGGAAAALIVDSADIGSIATASELLVVVAAATAYFATDLLLSAVSVRISGGGTFARQLVQPQMLLAIACFVPFDTLGYLAAVVHRSTPWWMLSLLGVPLVTLLVATRAITRGQENARRLTALFDAAVRAQTLTTRSEVEHALVDDARRLLRLSQVAVRSTPPGRGEIGAVVRDGEMPVWLVAKALDRARSTSHADEQALKALAAVAAEAMGRLELTDDMVHIARHDALTDLPNRGILLDRVTQALHANDNPDRPLGLLFVDLDGFKPVNDRFGHEVGDAVLVAVAQRLRACVDEVGTVARLGGDEFAVLFENRRPLEVEVMSDQLLATLAEDLVVDSHTLNVGASAGLAFAGEDDTATGLVRKADIAMYASKLSGKGHVEEYVDTMGRSRMERLEIVDDLRTALARKEIEVVYQPIVAVGSGAIVGAEALARWTRNGVPVPPDVFIPVAEDSGLVVGLGEHVLEVAAHDAATMRSAVEGAADGPFVLTVNISARQLREPSFVRSVRRVVDAMEGITLVLEITERQGIDLDPRILAAMEAINAAGARLAIDDFGVGFSSISYLHDLPVHYLKIDASLAQDIDTDERACALLRSVVAMGRTLDLGMIVEGIESEGQLTALGDETEDLCAQGFLMYRPMPVGQLVGVISADRTISSLHTARVRRWQSVATQAEATA